MNVPPDTQPIEELAREAAAAPLLSEPIGAYLAGHRRLRGISLTELSRQTLIPIRSLERLEQGSFDGQADGFVRGFVRTVALALGLDPEEAVSRLRAEPGAGTARRPIARLSLPRVFLTAITFIALAGLFALADALLDRGPIGPSEISVPTVVRRDPVRALAEAQGVEGLRESAALERANGLPGDR